MTPPELLTHLQTLGCVLRLDAGTLHVSPRALLTPDLREAIRTHKAALMALLTAPVIEDDDPGPWGFRSAVLDADVWLCMTEADAAALRAEGAVAYLPAEIRALQAMRARAPEGFTEQLLAVHQAKEVFGVAIAEVGYVDGTGKTGDTQEGDVL